jgi:hypothetical protein
LRAENEVFVDSRELRAALQWIGRGKAAKFAETRFHRSDEGFVVEAPMARTVVKSAGRWTCTVAVNAAALKRLVAKLPAGEITLTYVEGSLIVGSTRITARTD